MCLVTNAEDVLLVSIHKYGYIEEQPCIVYRLNAEGGLAKYAEVSVAGGTRMTEVSPDGRFLAVWQYVGQRSDRFPLGQGRVTIMDLTSPEASVEIPLPFEPVRGGFLRQNPNLGLEVVTLGIKDLNPVVYSWKEKRILSSLETDFEWEDVQYRGMLKLHDDSPSDSSGSLRFTGDPENGGLKAFPSGPQKKEYQSRIKLDTAAKGLLAPLASRELLLSCANTQVAVYHVQGRKPDPSLPAKALIFDKVRYSWHEFTPLSSVSDILIYGTWIVERTNTVVQTQENPDARMQTRKESTGLYRFYTLAGQWRFDWNPGSDSLLIGTLDGELIYRNGASVHSVPFTGESGVDTKNDRVIAQDERLSRVYWALPVPSD
jgi:hypothetical protein